MEGNGAADCSAKQGFLGVIRPIHSSRSGVITDRSARTYFATSEIHKRASILPVDSGHNVLNALLRAKRLRSKPRQESHTGAKVGSLAKVAKIKAPSESHSQPFSSRDAPCQRSHKGLTGHRQNRGRGGAKRSVEIHDLEKQGREFSDLDEASGHLHHSALSDARSLPNGIPYGDRTRSTPIHAVVAVMRLLVSVR